MYIFLFAPPPGGAGKNISFHLVWGEKLRKKGEGKGKGKSKKERGKREEKRGRGREKISQGGL